jgi:ABC-type tungstate transport system substrate-binding protein
MYKSSSLPLGKHTLLYNNLKLAVTCRVLLLLPLLLLLLLHALHDT